MSCCSDSFSSLAKNKITIEYLSNLNKDNIDFIYRGEWISKDNNIHNVNVQKISSKDEYDFSDKNVDDTHTSLKNIEEIYKYTTQIYKKKYNNKTFLIIT